MKKAILASMGIFAGAVALSAAGCEGRSKIEFVIEEGANAPHANLPAVPTLPPPPYPERHPDGAFSIWGVRHRAAQNWGHQVTVKGWIVRVYVPYVPNTNPPRVCGERDHCNEEKPYVFIADAQNEQDPTAQLMITGYAGFQSEIDDARREARSGHPPAPSPPGAPQPPVMPIDFYEGAQISVTGNFARRAANGHADSNGLIEYARYTTITPSPNAPRERHH